ncbi:restriction endonuclease subunit S [Vibrio diabolicus]|uniref:restriction endonuclease subunit S n=1 Tax=Vibrio diabolicus TaxID=50719 RepID=UPI002119EFCB|nr:restriction endonuclease subunit S [Vibrio diabolicus]MCQ9063692.1 restriction endonuclease subunit S [Vibrio diabolicus]
MTGRYKAYPEYKKPNIKFVNDIPTHWIISKVRHISAFGRGLAITKANLQDTGIPCVSYGEVHSKFGFEVDPKKHSLKCVSEEYLASSPYALLSKGDFVFADTSEDIDGSGNFTQLVSDDTLFAGYHTVIVRPSPDNYYRFLAYLFDSPEFRTQVRDAVKGVKVFSVTQAILKNASVWLPSFDEQQKIANFLDHETAKIDTLITKQEKLIELLKEKRQAVVSHAVTKGLNPDAPMKDSGVEWLGEVPKHWDVIFIKHLSQVKRGASPRPIDDPKYFDDNGEYAWTRIADVSSSGMYLTETTQRLSTLGSSLSVRLEAGELFLSIAGTVGKPCITTSKACIHDGFVYFPQLRINNKYLYYIFDAGQAYLGLGKMGTQLNLNTDTVGGIKIGLPPANEIEEIISYIEQKNTQYSDLISKAVSSIDLMKERKTALISAAVTGKIDVRDWQQPTEQQG